MRKTLVSGSANQAISFSSRIKSELFSRMLKNRWLYILLLPGLVYFLLFKYLPMWGIVIAFQNYQPFLGISGSEWVGLDYFERFFTDEKFWLLLRNTSVLAVLNIVFFFPLPIVIALMLNELRSELYKRFLQTLIYVPHFVSWVVVVGIVYIFFSTEEGIINQIAAQLGFEKINFLLSKAWFPVMVTAEVIWKETGWGTIIFLAALASVDVSLYESAKLDGAGRWRLMWHITLPGIRSTIIILFILRLGQFLDTSFEQIFLMVNAANREVGDVYFVAEGSGRFPNFFPIAIYTSKERVIEEINGLPRDLDYQLFRLPVNRNFAYYHKKNGKLVGMDGVYHEHYHHKDHDNKEDDHC